MFFAKHTERRDRFRQKLEQQGLQAYLVLQPANRFYLSGFELHDPQHNESAGCLLITAKGQDYLCTDARYMEAARRIWQGTDVFLYRQNRNKQLGEFLQQLGLQELGFESRIMSYETYAALKEHVQLEPCPGLVEDLRRIKDDQEIASLQDSCSLNHQVLNQIEQEITQPGINEKELAWRIEVLFRERGASELAFPAIVAQGPNAALPHHRPGNDLLQPHQPLLIDSGARLHDYCSDQSRTYWLSPDDPPDYFRKTRELVRQAQDLALQSIEPELPAQELYQKVWDFFAGHGVPEQFTHALGDGIGLETHEAPSLGPNSQDILLPGMVLTIEPGLYYPQWGGVRWEYMVLVTADGSRTL